MARKRRELSGRAERRLRELAHAGRTAEQIATALRVERLADVSRATIGRRMREARPEVSARRSSPCKVTRAEYAAAVAASPVAEDAAASAADVDNLPPPGEVPESATLDQIDRWLSRAENFGRAAAAKGDLAGVGQMGRLAKDLLEAKRRASPPATPNDPAPDWKRVTADARARFHFLIDQALGARLA